MFKIDLHTHSVGSPDGGLRVADYRRMIRRGGLDFVAITDHNTIDFACEMQKELGERIIIGEEITAREGEIIGLFLREVIPAGLAAAEAAAKIHEQGGLVYIPHPFETVRSGISPAALDAVADHVDIVEAYNGRAMFQNRSAQAKAWAAAHHKPIAASSDAHGPAGWGRTFSVVAEKSTTGNLAQLLASSAYQARNVGMRGALYPKFNRLKKKFNHA